MNSTYVDLSGHCRKFYSNNECKGCTKAHCHRTKRLVQKLQSLKLFYRVSSGFLLPREELKDFYNHINNNRICLNFYLFSECHERHSSGHQHIEMSTQKDKLKPEPIEAVTLGGPMVSDAYFQETMACDCKFCAKKREELGEEFGFSNIGNVSNSNEENHEIQRNEENTKNNDFERDTRDRKKKKNSEERSEESREKNEDVEKPQKKQKKTKKEKVEKKEEKEEISKKISKKTKKTDTDKKERKREDSDSEDNEKIIKTKSKKKLEETEINNDKLKAAKKKQSSSKKEDKNKKSKKKKDSSESSEQNSSNQPSEDEDEEVKRNESQDEEEQEVCARCRQKGIICEFLPCNHRNFCMVCAEKIYREVNKKCSICLRKIELFKI